MPDFWVNKKKWSEEKRYNYNDCFEYTMKNLGKIIDKIEKNIDDKDRIRERAH